jgi:hypothetical protein
VVGCCDNADVYWRRSLAGHGISPVSKSPPRLARAPRELGDGVRSGEDEVSRMLGLGGSMDQKFSIVAKFLEPSGDVRGLIRDDRVRDSGFGAKVGCSHLRYEFFF